MDSSQKQSKISREEEDILRVLHLPSGLYLPMILKAAIELDLFEIMAKAGPEAQLSSDEIAAAISSQNHHAPALIGRIMRFLASHSILNCSISGGEDGIVKRLYGLEPICKHFVRNEYGTSLGSLLLLPIDKVMVLPWYNLKDAILEGGAPFDKAHGMHIFDYASTDSRFNKVLNNAMYGFTTMAVRKILDVYNGFEGVKEMVDVGGGLGATLNLITSKYPNIRGINFDLPHVIKDAPTYAGVEHVGGDMFESVPKGEVIFMKWILHDWSDEHCLKLLKNCWKALPETGKVILVDGVLPVYPETDLVSKICFHSDVAMMTVNPGGKERTKDEIEKLAKSAGFADLKLICLVNCDWIIELYKN
ncbi:Flavone 3'-O-methyltransferase 1 [Forsythia ovata]|uniref:Flavone 3'-O-methyltransferase 1 n=1 Tax=Forsythia ovata TaxID=205694 RepID=A0ABD1RJ35_9LAMI